MHLVTAMTPMERLPGTSGHRLPTPFWTHPADSAFEVLASGRTGLTSAEAEQRLASDGPNVLSARIRQSVLMKVVRRIAEPLTAILLLSAAVSGFAGDWQSFSIIVLIVSLSTVLDIYQEQQAESAIDALKKSVAVTATVIRDGHPLELPVKDIVRGDVVQLRAGDLVPADGFVISSHGALANEASLTG